VKSYTELMLRFRWVVIVVTVAITSILTSQMGHLRVEIDPNRFLPQSHPYVATSDRVERIFGSRYVLVVGITPLTGTIYDQAVLGKVDRITRRMREVPGVVKENILSFAARKAKSITGTDEGMDVRPLMSEVPANPAEMEALRRRVLGNPAYRDILVSGDERSVAVLVEFKDDPRGFQSIMAKVKPIVDAERDPSVRIATGGLPVMLGTMEVYSQRMGFLLPIAMVLIAVVLWFAFGSVQGLALPMLTAILAVLWSLGIMSLFRVPLDVFNATTPVLILAVAAGHAVQILKRYYEEFQRQIALTPNEPREANRRAVIESLTRVGPVMLTAGSVAALGFLSLMIFEISSVRTFGIMAACGILSSMVLELSLIPAVRSVMRPPRAVKSKQKPGVLERAMGALAGVVTGPRAGWVLVVAIAVLGASAAGAARLRYAESLKEWFFDSLPLIQDDNHLNQSFAGTNTFYVLVESKTPGRMQDPDVLQAIDAMQKHLQQDANVGRSLSIADFVRRMNMAMHGDNPRYDTIPSDRDLTAQYLFLYSNSGDPGDFDTYVDYDYRRANIRAFLKEHDTAKLQHLVAELKTYVSGAFPRDVTVSFGGSVAQGTAIFEIVERAKLLNMLQVAAVFFVLASIVFRSVLAGILVLVPLAVTVVFNFGLMGWTGIPYNINNSITAAMAVGIGADYVIYLLFRLREENAGNGNPAEAMRRTLTSAGSAIVFVAVAVAAGYSVLLLSIGFWNHIWMGILISTAMITSATAAVTVVPVLVSWLRPAFIHVHAKAPVPTTSPAAIVVALCGALLCSDMRAADLPTAEQVMQQNFLVGKVVGSHSKNTTVLRNKEGQERVRESTTTTKLEDNGVDTQQIVKFHAPADVNGTSILLIEHSKANDDIWIYLPALKKVRRLVASNKKDSFAGTDFSYGDVIGYAVDDWHHVLVGDDTVNGEPCFLVESVPASQVVKETSGYSKRRNCVGKSHFTTLRTEVWDIEGQLLKEEIFGNFQNVDPAHGKWVAMRATARNVQTGHTSDVVFKDYTIDPSVSATLFTTRTLEFGS
jgi:predicted RND superfamily exporter protein/outer membrane lipoprotein-sorting protein